MQGSALKYRFINDHHEVWSITLLCQVMKVARSGFYVWLPRPVSAGEQDNQRLLMLIRDSYTLSGGIYGYRRVHRDRRKIGEICRKNRAAKICGRTAGKPGTQRRQILAIITAFGCIVPIIGDVDQGSQEQPGKDDQGLKDEALLDSLTRNLCRVRAALSALRAFQDALNFALSDVITIFQGCPEAALKRDQRCQSARCFRHVQMDAVAAAFFGLIKR